MARPKRNPLLVSIYNILSVISLGPKDMPVGRGEAPECDPPYLIISSGFGGDFSGPWTDPDADEMARIQITAVGETDEQAAAALDLAREALTRTALIAEGVADRTVLSVNLDVSRNLLVEQRGLPNPLFSHIDQYLVHTTPG